jgi:hypothetical protein
VLTRAGFAAALFFFALAGVFFVFAALALVVCLAAAFFAMIHASSVDVRDGTDIKLGATHELASRERERPEVDARQSRSLSPVADAPGSPLENDHYSGVLSIAA